jgi:hypothetical protein
MKVPPQFTAEAAVPGTQLVGREHQVTTDDTSRREYAAGLRKLADIIDDCPEVPLPYEGTNSPLMITFFRFEYDTDEDVRQAMMAARKAIGGQWDKDASSAYFNLDRHLFGLKLQLTAPRESVCERVVVGTHEETKQKPIKYETVTETIEDVRWECSPVLSGKSLDVTA